MAKAYPLVNSTIISKVTSSDPKLNVTTKGPLALSKALKTSQQLYRASRIDSIKVY